MFCLVNMVFAYQQFSTLLDLLVTFTKLNNFIWDFCFFSLSKQIRRSEDLKSNWSFYIQMSTSLLSSPQHRGLLDIHLLWPSSLYVPLVSGNGRHSLLWSSFFLSFLSILLLPHYGISDRKCFSHFFPHKNPKYSLRSCLIFPVPLNIT